MVVICFIIVFAIAGIIAYLLTDNTPATPSNSNYDEEAVYEKFKKLKAKEEQLKRFEERYKKEKGE